MGVVQGGWSEELSQTEVIRDEIWQLSDYLKDSKSLGPDNIPPRVLKEVKCEIVALGTQTFNFHSNSLPSGGLENSQYDTN